MGLVNSFEPRLRWLAFPSLLRGIGIIHFVVVVALLLRPEVANVLTFDWVAITTKGEVWRLVSFLFLVFPGSLFNLGVVGVLLAAFFGLRITFVFNDALENAWGVFRTSCFIYGCALGQIIANVILAQFSPLFTIPSGGEYLYLAAFFAFATLFPKHSFLLMLIIPVHVYILALLAGFLLLMACVSSPFFAFFSLLAFAPYLWWGIPMALRNGKNRGQVARRRVEFQSKTKNSDGASFHRCKDCGATEKSHPDRDFRVTADDDEICSQCLQEAN